jgi:hypothetical protein
VKPSGQLVRHKPLLRKTPLKPGTKRMKRRHRACGPPTVAQQAHQDLQRADGCAMCHLLGFEFNERDRQNGISPCGRTAVHHINTGDLAGQKQLGQDDTVALGDYHHQGTPKRGFNSASMRAKYGPNLFDNKRAFLDAIDERLGEHSVGALQRWRDLKLDAAQPEGPF